MTDILDLLKRAGDGEPLTDTAVREAHDEIVRLRRELKAAPLLGFVTKPKRKAGEVDCVSAIAQRWWARFSMETRLEVHDELRRRGLYLRAVGPSWSTHRPDTDEIVDMGIGGGPLLHWAGKL